MSRIPTPSSIDAAPANALPHLEGVNKMLGSVPNLFRIVATSPAALEGYLGMFGALGKGTLPAPIRERIALAIAEQQRLLLLSFRPHVPGQEPRQAHRGRDFGQPTRLVERSKGRRSR